MDTHQADRLLKQNAALEKELAAKNRALEVEAALEKVRSRSLLVHSTDEFTDVVKIVFQQLQEVGVAASSVSINIFIEGSNDTVVYICGQNEGELTLSHFRLFYFDHPILTDRLQVRKNGLDFFSKTYGAEEKNSFYTHLFDVSELKLAPEEIRRMVLDGPAYTMSLAVQKASMIVVNDFTGKPLPESQINIVKRFSRVFEQAYIRFLDLQKAEAQALRAEQDLVEIKLARKKAEDALTELRATQRQLIQVEKMASLGELTAGIAHEIQNPLNFVNNFSEINKELVAELKQEVERGNFEEVKTIANSIEENEEKISHHGRRADAIVKGMLQHSRTSPGEKEPTDINALADEYLRLSYHGARANAKDFNVQLQTDYDNTIEKISAIPQDISRVLLNLYNNAFYAVQEKKRRLKDAYLPVVNVSTRQSNGQVEIVVSDNGNGIAQKNIDKVFQPFFTTKPTGEGTGLGLSLGYDIITRGHNGTIKVESKEGEYSRFIIQLPKQ